MRLPFASVLAFALACFLCAAGSPASADILDEALSDFPLADFGRDVFTKIDDAKTDQYSATVGGVTAYVWSPPAGKPVVAVFWPRVLQPSDLVDGLGDLFDISLANPVLFWTKTEGVLKRAEMPNQLAAALEAKTGIPAEVKVAARYNLFGKLESSTALAAANLPALLVGFSRKDGDYVATMSVPAGQPWVEPFHLARTTVSSGTIRVLSTDKKKTVEAWGTAQIDGASTADGFTMYAKQEAGVLQSLGFDARDASLKDFFAILGIASGTAGKQVKLPSFPTPPAGALDVVALSNPSYAGYNDSSPPALATMLFQIALPSESGSSAGTGELNVNAKGKLFDVPVAQILLRASAAGARLEIPAECPLVPIGVSVDLSNVTTSKLPVRTELANCFGDVLGGILSGAEDLSKEVASITGDAASTASSLADQGYSTASSLLDTRKRTWNGALQTARAPIDAVNGWSSTFESAKATVLKLEDEIVTVGKDIERLANKIANYAEAAWGWVSGQVSDWTKQKSGLSAKKQTLKTQKADAQKLADEAEERLAEAKQKIGNIPGANFNKDLTDTQHGVQGSWAQFLVQNQVGAYAEKLRQAEILASARADGDGDGVGDGDALVGKQRKYFSDATELSPELLARRNSLVADTRSALVADGVGKLVRAEESRKLSEVVSSLPTMAFDVPVRMESTQFQRCLAVVDGEVKSRRGCRQTPDEIFVFQTDGRVRVGSTSTCLALRKGDPYPNVPGKPYVATTCDQTTAAQFFFDPIDSFIRYLPGVANATEPFCLVGGGTAEETAVPFGPCNSSGSRFYTWRLLPAGEGVRSLATASLSESSPSTPSASKPGATLLEIGRTNLAPLTLPPDGK